ncbi:hypothetical protein ACC725_38145, partial [Rhizobium ruizarguesonis]
NVPRLDQHHTESGGMPCFHAVDKVPSHNIRYGPSGCDGTGLKVFGEGEWLEDKHKTKAKRKRWANCPLVTMMVRTGFPVLQP